jgi:hypothetical protein
MILNSSAYCTTHHTVQTCLEKGRDCPLPIGTWALAYPLMNPVSLSDVLLFIFNLKKNIILIFLYIFLDGFNVLMLKIKLKILK